MRFAMSLRSFSLGLATASLMVAGAASAQSMQSVQLMGVNARLDHSLDSQTAKPGQAVEAKLDGSVKTPGGVDLAKGTELWGKVDAVQASRDGSPSSVSLVFTTAQLKDGQKIPVKVTLLGAYPANEGIDATYGTETMGPAPKQVSSKEQIDQEPGLLGKVAMTSAVPAQNSGTFTQKKGNVRLLAGTYFQVGIAPTAHGSTTTRAAE